MPTARPSEEPGAGKPNAGICEGGRPVTGVSTLIAKKMRLAISVLNILLYVAPNCGAAELNDEKRGFSLTVPKDFISFPEGKTAANIIHCYLLGDPSDSKPDIVFNVQLHPKTFLFTERLKKSELPATWSLEEYALQGVSFDLVKQRLKLEDGTDFVSFWIQLPLSPKAIQLNLGGLESREPEIRAHFTSILASFSKDKPWHGTTAARPVSPNSSANRAAHGMSGLLRLIWFSVAGAIIIFFLFRKIKTPKEKKRG